MILLHGEESNFLNFLNHQINQRESFFKKIPQFKRQINLLDFKLSLKESILKIRREFENRRKKSIYRTVIAELDDLIKNRNKQ